MNCNILFVRKPFLTHGTFEPVLYPTFKSHVPVKIIIPVIRLATLATFKGLLGRLLLVLTAGWAGPAWLRPGRAGQLQSGREGGRGGASSVAEGQRELREEIGGSLSLDTAGTGLGVTGVVRAGLGADKWETGGWGLSSLALLHILGLGLYHIDCWYLVCGLSVRVALAPDLLDGEVQGP